MADRKIDYLPLDDIRRDPTNAKGHDAALIEASIGRLGYIAPASMDERTGLLVEGHGRLDALIAKHARGDDPPDGVRKLKDGRWAMPVSRGWASADDVEAARALIVLNRATELGGWMPELLHVAVAKLPDLELTGWARIEDLPPLAPFPAVGPTVVPYRPKRPPAAARRAEVRILPGDCVEVLAGLEAESVDAVVCDPPYGLEFMGKAWDSFRVDDPGTNRHRGEHAGDHGSLDNSDQSTPQRRTGVAYGGGARAKTARCTGCGKRDQFRNDHGCVEGARWVDVVLDPFAAPPTMLAFEEWARVWAREALRVLKPGGHLLAFGGSRTYHRMASGIEDAGFEVRDSIHWIYGSGFPKSLDVSKAVDDKLGAERTGGEREWSGGQRSSGIMGENHGTQSRVILDEPASPEGERWEGWGTALKPAHEPIIVARKPLAGTVAETVLAFGTGGLNVDGTRVEMSAKDGERWERGRAAWAEHGEKGRVAFGAYEGVPVDEAPGGRWPPNVVLDESAAAELDRQSGDTVSRRSAGRNGSDEAGSTWGLNRSEDLERGHDDEGGASRFFPVFKYEAKASTAERNAGLDHPEEALANVHATVKPVELMRWLVRLVTPPGGVVLDPFAGSGTTLVAAVLEGFDAIGVEMTAEYLPIIEGRVAWAHDQIVLEGPPDL